MPLLDIRNLTIEFKTGEGWVKAVDASALPSAKARSAAWWANQARAKA